MIRKFFDAQWVEVLPEQAAYAVDLEHAPDGTVLSSTTYFAAPGAAQAAAKEGSWVTIDDRPVFIGGPGQGGGGVTGTNAELSTATSFASSVMARLGVTATVEFKAGLTAPDLAEPSGEIEVHGMYDPKTNTCLINTELLNNQGDPDAVGFDHKTTAGMGYRSTIAHELLHVLDGGYDSRYSRSKDFDKLFVIEKTKLLDGDLSRAVSRYAMTSAREFFAENGTVYLLEPTQLQRMAPDVYVYFDKLLGGGE